MYLLECQVISCEGKVSKSGNNYQVITVLHGQQVLKFYNFDAPLSIVPGLATLQFEIHEGRNNSANIHILGVE